MCTATYVPLRDGCLFGANRDEHVKRKSAWPPGKVQFSKFPAIYPVDGEKGGTWVGILGNGLMACLLNGAFHSYTPNPPYRKSRGLIIPDLFEAGDPKTFIEQSDFTGIEPFTLITIPPVHSSRSITELRWDGAIQYVQYLDPSEPHLWASAPLNSGALLAKKTDLFKEWLHHPGLKNIRALSQFHHQTDPNQPEEGILMETDHQVQTVSITLMKRKGIASQMLYEDLKQRLQFEEKLSLNTVKAE